MIDPNRTDDTSGLGALAGVGVAFFLLCALRRYLETSGWFKARKRPNLGTLLDLVALGTVADVVPLDHVNRVLVNAGLNRIRAGRCRPGITGFNETLLPVEIMPKKLSKQFSSLDLQPSVTYY